MGRTRKVFRGGTEHFQFPKIALLKGMIVASMNAPTRPLTVMSYEENWAECSLIHGSRTLIKRFAREVLVPLTVSQ